ncbi:MAG: hypothetical protein LC722_04865 [Actinobacteria bacterium]|nr:hypothetical protein [Actinomycetota bacterium]
MPLLVAGTLGLAGAVIHGGVGELLVVRRLSPKALPETSFGGGGMTKAMIRAAWHMTTMAFVTVGTSLILSGSVLSGELARGVALVAAWLATIYAAMVMGAVFADPRRLIRHPAPVLLTAVATLAWLGIA